VPGDSGQPVFIVGTPRSGTTLTAKILGRHSRLFMPGETHFFDDVYSRAAQLGDPGNSAVRLEIARRLHTIYGRYYEQEDQQRITRLYPAPQDLAEALDGCTGYGMILDRFMNLQMQSEGKLRWGNNAPRDLFSVREIREYFPDAKLVVCVRDIRAFLYSYKGKWKITGDKHVERLKKLYHPVVTSFLWKSSMQQLSLLEDLVPPADRIVVHYEDLVTDPEGTVRNICTTIEEDYEPDMLVVEGHNSSTATDTRGIFSSSVDIWRTELSQEEIVISQNIGGSLLNRLGYDVIPAHAGRLQLFSLWVSTPFALWRALNANKDTRGPLIPYLFKRIGTLLGLGR
jgi:Sulfotransferase family